MLQEIEEVKTVKGFVRKVVKTAVLIVIVWAMEVKVEEEEEEEPDNENVARDAAYLTTGLITAVRAVNDAHAKGKNCGPHHKAVGSLLKTIEDQMTAVLVIQHLLEIAVQSVSDEDVQRMVANIVAHELGADDDEDEDLD